jgi:hypothetical protein
VFLLSLGALTYLLALACEISRRTNGSKSHCQSVRSCMFRGQTWGYLMGGSQLLPLQPTSGRPSCRGELVRYVPRSQRFDRGPWATSHSTSNSSAIRSSNLWCYFHFLTKNSKSLFTGRIWRRRPLSSLAQSFVARAAHSVDRSSSRECTERGALESS